MAENKDNQKGLCNSLKKTLNNQLNDSSNLNEKSDTNSFKNTNQSNFSSTNNFLTNDQTQQPSNSYSNSSDSNSKLLTPSSLNNVASSPPNFVSLDEIMKATNGMHSIYLAHKILLDKNFKITKNKNYENILNEQMRKVFWNILESQLNESPPKYKQAMFLLKSIKEDIFALLPRNSQIKQEIDEILDLDLIKQKAENGALDFYRYAQYILSVLARLCAPVRDEMIRELTQSNNVVHLFKGILEIIDLMKLDMANFNISQIRPHLMKHSSSLEKQKFNDFLEISIKNDIDGLKCTKMWLKKNFDALDLDLDSEKPNEIINRIIISSYIDLLNMDKSYENYLPETHLMDKDRIENFQNTIYDHLIVGTIILVVFANVPILQNIPKFKEELKSTIMILFTSDTNLSEIVRLENIVLQIAKEIYVCLKNHNLSTLDESKEINLKTQIIDISNKENKVRKIVQRRISEFIELVLTSSSTSSVQLPIGLSILKDELISFTGQFVKFVSYSRSVFDEYYVKIIEDLLKTK